MTDMKEITFEELMELKKKSGAMGVMPRVKIEGTVTVIDKDGKVKGNMDITSELPEE